MQVPVKDGRCVFAEHTKPHVKPTTCLAFQPFNDNAFDPVTSYVVFAMFLVLFDLALFRQARGLCARAVLLFCGGGEWAANVVAFPTVPNNANLQWPDNRFKCAFRGAVDMVISDVWCFQRRR
jgi:hypothetical protein